MKKKSKKIEYYMHLPSGGGDVKLIDRDPYDEEEKHYYLYLYDGPFEKPHKQCLAAGPFPTKTAADAKLQEARAIASGVDPWTDFMHWATIALPDGNRKGKLNERMGL